MLLTVDENENDKNRTIFYHTLKEHWEQMPEPKGSFIKFLNDYFSYEKKVEQWLRENFPDTFNNKENDTKD